MKNIYESDIPAKRVQLHLILSLGVKRASFFTIRNFKTKLNEIMK
jgi:hypothetical protein